MEQDDRDSRGEERGSTLHYDEWVEQKKKAAEEGMRTSIRKVVPIAKGGRKRTTDPKRPKSLYRMEEERKSRQEAGTGNPAQRLGPTVSSREVYYVLGDPSRVTPRTLAALVHASGKRGVDALAFLAEIAPDYMAFQAWKLVEAFAPVAAGLAGQLRIDIETTVHVRAWSDERASAQEALRDVQQTMVMGSDFGWVTDVAPGFRITAASRPVSKLVGIQLHHLNESYLLEDPLRSRLEQMLENFGEYMLIIGMLTSSALADCVRSGTTPNVRQVVGFFGWLRDYVEMHEKEIARQIEETPPSLMDDTRSREDLRQCLDAARGKTDWPAYDPKVWNSIRMHVKAHRLLPARKVARFVKRSRPIPHSRMPIGYEVTWLPEEGDRAASELVRAIYRELRNAPQS